MCSSDLVTRQGLALLNLKAEQVLVYINTGRMPPQVRDALMKAVELKRSLTDFERSITEAQAEIRSITDEQSRIRENMRTVDRNSPYYNRLMTKLNEQESKIETLQTQIDKNTDSRERTRTELETYLAGLSVGS